MQVNLRDTVILTAFVLLWRWYWKTPETEVILGPYDIH